MSMYVLAIDQSTTATKALLFDEHAELIGRCNKAHKQIHPEPGWIEHDPEEIYTNTVLAIKGVLAQTNTDKKKVAVLSITNQRETTLIWDANGKPVYNAVVWQCARAESITKEPKIYDHAKYIEETSGLKLSPYFSAAKAKWICDHARTGPQLYFGTMDSWLIYKLTGNHATDYSNASRTQLFNIRSLEWDWNLINIFDLSYVQFPKVQDADSIFGYTTIEGFFDKPIPVAGVLGDSHAALFGQQCWSEGKTKATFGTGSSVMMNIGEKPLASKNGLATSIAWRLDGKAEYVFEGNINCSGDTLKWMVDELGILPNVNESQEYAKKVSSSEGVYVVPAFVGLGAPYWKSDARAIICGLFRSANKYHIIRAGIESMAYQLKDIVLPMLEDAGLSLSELRVDGGPTNNELLMQFVSDILNTKVIKNKIEEVSALGVAYIGGLTVGLWANRHQIEPMRGGGREYVCAMPIEAADKLYAGWRAAAKMLLQNQ